MQILQPPGWAKPRGFSNGISASGKLVFVAGQIGWTGESKWEAKDFAGQFRQTLKNTLAVLAEAGGKPEHIVRMTWYIVDKGEYLGAIKEVGAAYRDLIGRHYPAMAVLQVGALMEDEARIEIETTAVVPDPTSAEAARRSPSSAAAPAACTSRCWRRRPGRAGTSPSTSATGPTTPSASAWCSPTRRWTPSRPTTARPTK
jgi:enamine deaminase RidA (YjgF/YER057c/UK114 family)